MRLALLSLILLTGCTTADMFTPHQSFTQQQRVGMIAMGSQMMATPAPPPAYQPTRCYTRRVYNQLVTNCY